MANLNAYYKLSEKYANHSNIDQFALVYTFEEHPTVDWFDNVENYRISQHENIEQRLYALELTIDEWAKTLQFEFKQKNEEYYKQEIIQKFLLLLDNMDNDLYLSFNIIPERFVVLCNGIIVYKSNHGQWASWKELDRFLSKI